MSSESKTASYRVIADFGGNRYRFFCERSGLAICTTNIIRADTPQEELCLAWETEGRAHFSKCPRCGKWVADLMFNIEASECVVCSPWEESKNFCPNCGRKIQSSEGFCRKCGEKL